MGLDVYIHSCMLSKVAEIRKINRGLQPSDLMMVYLICVTIDINGEQRIAALSTLQCRLLNRMFGFHNNGQIMCALVSSVLFDSNRSLLS